jgi:TPR repeat protein
MHYDHAPIDQLLIDLLKPSRHAADHLALVQHIYNRPGPHMALLQRSERDRHRRSSTPMWLRAVRLLIERAEEGDGLAMFHLGRWNRLGIGMAEDPEQARQWYELGAENGHSGCMLHFARMIAEQQPEQARQWLQQAQALGDPASHAFWAHIFADQAQDHLEHGVSLGDPFAMLLMGERLLKNNPTYDVNRAMKLLMQAHDAHVSEASIRLAHIYEHGLHGQPLKPDAALFWSSEAAGLGHPFGCGMYGRLIRKHNPTEALRQLRYSAMLGETHFLFELGDLLMSEGTRPRDQREAVHWWQMGVNIGQTQSMSALAWALTQGRGCKADPQAAMALHERAAALGQPEAQISLGVALMNGEHIEANPERGFNLFVLASLQEEPNALFLQGMAWEQGDGTSQDLEQAYRCYLQAAQLGLPKAAFAVAMAHIWGEGATKDLPAGAKWMSYAAEAGHSPAQVYLGMMFRYGYGVKPSDRLAKKWLQKAIDQGDPLGMREMALLLQDEDPSEHDDAIRRLMGAAAAQGNRDALEWIQEHWPKAPEWLLAMTRQS